MLDSEIFIRDVLLKHARHPLRSGDTSNFARQGQCKNPLCGDFVAVGVELDGDKIAKIRIQPTGCGISIASASLMAELIEGRSAIEALALFRQFSESLVSKRLVEWPAELSILKPLARLRENPTKVPCALVGWFAFKDAVKSTATVRPSPQG